MNAEEEASDDQVSTAREPTSQPPVVLTADELATLLRVDGKTVYSAMVVRTEVGGAARGLGRRVRGLRPGVPARKARR